MLTKPENGWSDFELGNVTGYSLSYLNDIAFEWVDQAIYGLENMTPFCVRANLEPDRFLCTVSYWRCYIVIESDDPAVVKDGSCEAVNTSMIEFCKNLHSDICSCVDAWVSFNHYKESEIISRKKLLIDKLDKLNQLIKKNKKHFEESSYFL